MADQQNAILRILVPLNALAEPCSVSVIRDRLGGVPTRKRVLEALGKLMQKKLVARVNRQTGFEPVEPVYQATAAGREFVIAGKRVTSGPNGPLTATRVREGETFRQRLWNALRIQKKATLPQLIEIARDKRDGNVEANALKYMGALVRAGVAVRLPTREKGHALTSPGHVRWALIRDLGPRAPQAARSHLVNLNEPRHPEKLIPYGASK